MSDEDAHGIHKPNYPHFSTEELDEEEGEALSLCDLPLNDMSSRETFPSSSLSEASEFFDFSNDVVSDMCPADEIIFCGKLEPFKHKPQYDSRSNDQNQTHIKPVKESNNPPSHCLRSDPLSGLRSPVYRSSSVGAASNTRRSMMIPNSRSLDYRKLHRSSSSLVFLAPETERNSWAIKKATKPRWYSVMFGTVKVPPEMELRDMKNRQVRRNPSTSMFPSPTDAGGKLAENRSPDKVSCRILRALSCKDRRSVSVTMSLAMPQAT